MPKYIPSSKYQNYDDKYDKYDKSKNTNINSNIKNSKLSIINNISNTNNTNNKLNQFNEYKEHKEALKLKNRSASNNTLTRLLINPPSYSNSKKNIVSNNLLPDYGKSLVNTRFCFFCNKDIMNSLMVYHNHPSKIFDWLYIGCYMNVMNIAVFINNN